MLTKTPDAAFEQWANMAVAMRNAADGAGRYEAKGGLMCRSEGPDAGMRTMTYFAIAAFAEGGPPKPLHRQAVSTHDDRDSPINHWVLLPEALLPLSRRATASADKQRAMFASDIEMRCRFSGRVTLPCIVRGGHVFMATDCTPRASMLTDRERMRRSLGRMGLRMMDERETWDEFEDAGRPCLTFTLGHPSGPRIPQATDPLASLTGCAAVPMEGHMDSAALRDRFNDAVADFSTPSEWLCEAHKMQAGGCGLAPSAPIDATEAFLAHLSGTRLARGDRAGDDALVCAHDGTLLNAAEVMAAGADQWAAQMLAPVGA